MNEIVIQNPNLPDKLEDLSRFVLIGNEKLNSVRAEIRAIDKLKLAEDVRAQKMEEASMLSEALLDAEVRLGELFKMIPKGSSGNGSNQYNKVESAKTVSPDGFSKIKPKKEVIADLGFSENQARRFEILANNKDLVEQVKAEARENDDIPTKTRVLDLAAQQKRTEKECDEYDDFIDSGVKVYKELAKIIDAIEKFEVTPRRMEALRENYDEVMTAGNQIEYINMAIDKLNKIKSELWRSKKRC